MKQKKYFTGGNIPYCKGCGHTLVFKSVISALTKLDLSPLEATIITDIGCVGLADSLFSTNTVHTIHGRSTAVATGLRIADGTLYGKENKYIVFIGDGGAGIGISHLIDAARLNVNITVLLHNNFLYGMTGGQHSGFTPCGFITSTTKTGNPFPDIDIIDILRSSHAGFLARNLAVDRGLADTIASAVEYPGFSMIEIIEICTGYAARWNRLSRKAVLDILRDTGKSDMGILVNRKDRKPFALTYKRSIQKKIKKESSVKKTVSKEKNVCRYRLTKHKLSCLSFIAAGSAGEGVQFASGIFLNAAVKEGYHGIQKNDNPVTIGSGFSISEVGISIKEILYYAVLKPDFFIITTKDGLACVYEKLKTASEDCILLIDDTLNLPKTKAQIIAQPFAAVSGEKNLRTLTAIGYLLKKTKAVSIDSLTEAISETGKNKDKLINAINKGFELF